VTLAHDWNAKPRLARGLACACMLLLAFHPAKILAQASAFDGKWRVVQHCPPRDGVDGAKGYTQHFDVHVANGEMRGE
jgi:hypothetical protein